MKLEEQGKREEAARLYSEISKSMERVYGPTHEFTLGAKLNYAERLGLLGRMKKVAKIYKQVMKARIAVYGPEHLASI